MEPFCLQSLDVTDSSAGSLEEICSSTPILVVNPDGMSFREKSLHPISDLQSTICYDQDTVIVSRGLPSLVKSQESVVIVTEEKLEKEAKLTRLYCSLAVLCIILWSAEKSVPPSDSKLDELHAMLMTMLKEYDI